MKGPAIQVLLKYSQDTKTEPQAIFSLLDISLNLIRIFPIPNFSTLQCKRLAYFIVSWDYVTCLYFHSFTAQESRECGFLSVCICSTWLLSFCGIVHMWISLSFFTTPPFSLPHLSDPIFSLYVFVVGSDHFLRGHFDFKIWKMLTLVRLCGRDYCISGCMQDSCNMLRGINTLLLFLCGD